VKEREYLKDLGVDARTVLKRLLKNLDGRSELMCLKVGTTVKLF